MSWLHGMMSIFSPCSSWTTAWTRLPFMPTQAPTGSIELSWLITPILARLPGIAGGGLDLDDAVVNLGHFLREQLLHEVGMGARLRKICGPRVSRRTRQDQRADAVADADHFARDLLRRGG